MPTSLNKSGTKPATGVQSKPRVGVAYRRKWKAKDTSHLVSLSSMKLNKQRDAITYIKDRIKRRKQSKSESGPVEYHDPTKPFPDRVRESLLGKEIDDSLVWKFVRQAKDEHGFNPYVEFERFLCFIRDEMEWK
jgi:hypothetical protein